MITPLLRTALLSLLVLGATAFFQDSHADRHDAIQHVPLHGVCGKLRGESVWALRPGMSTEFHYLAKMIAERLTNA